jgi:hypothetical protein
MRFQTGYYSYYGSFVAEWLNGTGMNIVTNQGTLSPNSARSDWVTRTFTGATVGGVAVRGDGDPISYGCALAFIFYLYTQLSFSIADIISNYSGTLQSVYNALTGDPGNPFPFFAALIENAYPSSVNAVIPGPVSDNPFPLGILSPWCNNNTFGKDQVKDVIAKGGVVSNAFYLVLEGFSAASLGANGVTVPTPTGGFASLSGIKVQPSPATIGNPPPAQAIPIYEDPTNTQAPQRIRFSFDIVFTSVNAFPQNAGDAPVTAVLNAAAQIAGANVNGATCTLGFELLAGANPYFNNVDSTNPADRDYLSQDLRVFSVTAGQSPLPSAQAFTSDAYASIQTFIGWLNGNSTYTQSGTGPDPLNKLPGQTGYETTFSSVGPHNSSGKTVYNFAIARVRLQGSALDTATNCRVFFRLFVGQSTDTDFTPSTTYKSTLGASGGGADAGHPIAPLPSATGLFDPNGNTLQTIPYFATDINGTHDYDGANQNANIRDIQIPAAQDQIWTYFGCFLDIYDSSGNANLGGTHHCIVAEIAYSDAPIPTTTATGAAPTPLTWDQLAQRNLQITTSENPKSPATHVIPQAFDLRPSKALIPLSGQPVALPDELMIDWQNTPPGSVATIYWPGLSSAKVLALAQSLYASHLLSAADDQTIQCVTTRGITYIPIPYVPNVNFAGLLTIELPDTVTEGQLFEIMVRRVSTRRGQLPAPAPLPVRVNTAPSTIDKGAKAAADGVTEAEVQDSSFTWRQVCGAFKVRIPVTTATVMLPQEENTLAVLKWRLQEKPAPYRWRPVWERYIHVVAARVKGLGGDPNRIPPSLGGYSDGGLGHGAGSRSGQGHRQLCDRDEQTGKIDGVEYDRFGDFDGFCLRTEDGRERYYRASEAEIHRLVFDAWRERWVVTVVSRDRNRDGAAPLATRIILRRAPA